MKKTKKALEKPNRKNGKKTVKSGGRKMKQRNPDGTFKKGNTLGRKKKTGVKQRDVKALLREAITDDEWIKIFTAVKNKAMHGSLKAVQILLNYSIGRPREEQDTGDTEYLVSRITEAIEGLNNRGIQ